MNNKLLLGITIGSTILILLLGLLLIRQSQPAEMEFTQDANAQVEGEQVRDWGIVDINGGVVEESFQIVNQGSGNLEISNIKTSCMCTTAQVSINNEKSPVFGMHTLSGWRGVVKPGETADVKVIFDPLFHGPQGTGPVTRTVFIETNDPSNPAIELRVAANVVHQ